MKTKLQKLSASLQLLEAFEEKYQPGERIVCVHSLNEHCVPSIAFYGNNDREWILSTFGAEGWMASHRSEGWQHAEKMIDGVLVGFQNAHELEAPRSTKKEIPADVLTAQSTATLS